MGAHKSLASGDDFNKALETKDKYVLIHAEDGEPSDKAEEFASNYSSKCEFYSADTAAHPTLKEFFGISQVPAALLYKDGQQVKKAEGKSHEGMQQIVSMLG